MISVADGRADLVGKSQRQNLLKVLKPACRLNSCFRTIPKREDPDTVCLDWGLLHLVFPQSLTLLLIGRRCPIGMALFI